jgi:PKD repeat protein
MGVIVGVLSGGIVMYVSPVVDKAIKPQKPVANFGIETNDLKVTFHNLSTGGDGFWDFGDSSALVPATKQTEIITHAYSKPGRYTAKLWIRNFLGDENERTVQIDVRSGTGPQPKILSLQASPVSESAIAPATFRITSEAQNVQTCVWDFGRNLNEPLEVTSDTPNHQEKLVTFDKPGRYRVQLAAINDKQADRKFVPVEVKAAPANTLMGVLSVVDEGMRIEKKWDTVQLTLSADGTTRQFEKTIPARQGFYVTDVRLHGAPPPGVRNIAILQSADRTRATVSGEIQAGGRSVESTMIVIPVEMSIERKVNECRPVARSTIALSAPGATSLALACCPPEWIRSRRCMILELFDGPKRLERVQIPCPETKIAWQSHDYVLKCDIIGDQVTITVK